jgi:hypothetical protein
MIQGQYNRLPKNDILLFCGPNRWPLHAYGVSEIREPRSGTRVPRTFPLANFGFEATKDYESLLGLKLEPAPGLPAVDVAEHERAEQTLIATPGPVAKNGVKGVSISTADFWRSPIDYEERDRNSRKLGNVGEELVFAYERAELIRAGRKDLAERVEMVCRSVSESAATTSGR